MFHNPKYFTGKIQKCKNILVNIIVAIAFPVSFLIFLKLPLSNFSKLKANY